MSNDENSWKHLKRLVTQRRWLAIIMTVSGGFVTFFLNLGKEIPHANIFIEIFLVVLVGSAVTFLIKMLREPSMLAESIKGLSPFIEEQQDAELLDKLGRHADISNLRRDTIDEQIRLLVLKGKPGCGKSSVLRAGVKWEVQKLTDKEICYWQAAPDATIDDLTTEVNKASSDFQQVWQSFVSFAPLPSSQVANFDNKLRILIIDHFDFLRPDYGPHKVFFDLLERLCNDRSPYKLKCIIAFRDDYCSNWHMIRQRLSATARVSEAPLPSLHTSVARIVMRKILIRSGIDASNSALKRFLSRLAEGLDVRPIWIGLGTEAFSRWALSSPWRFVTRSRYLRAGGVKGVIAEYLHYHIKSVAPNHSVPLLRAIARSLIDEATGKRIMAGLQVADFRSADGMGPLDIASYLRALAAAKRRVLERVDSYPNEERYRLAQEQFAEIISSLDDQAPSDDRRLDWSFTEQFECWKQNRALRYLLDGKQVRGVIRRKELLKGPDNIARKRYFTKSLWMYILARIAAIAFGIGLIFAGYWLHKISTANYYGKLLEQWRLPGELYIKQEKLDALHIQSSRMVHLKWIKSNQLKELEINSTALSSLDGIAHVPHLTTLTLNIAQSPIQDLSSLGRLSELKSLTLFVGEAQNMKLDSLTTLNQLHTLRLVLDNSNIDVSALGNLPGLKAVTLDLQNSSGRNLASITQFGRVDELSINLRDSPARQMPDFPLMDNLTSLTLNLENSSIVRVGALQSLHSLKSLSINLKNATGINTLPDISTLTELECLDLNLEGSTVTQLPQDFNKLPKLKTLSLRLARSAVKRIPDLVELPKLQNLTLDITNTRIRNLPALGLKQAESKRGLESLALKLPSLSNSDLQKLHDLSFIHRLDLDMTASSNIGLPAFKDVTDLQSLTIHVSWSQLSKIPELPDLTQLTLHVQGSLPSDLSAEAAPLLLEPLIQLQTLTALTLYLDDSLINLPRFGESDHLNTFILHMKRVPIKALNNLADLKQLRTLTLDLESSSSLESLPGLAAMTHLSDLSLNLRGTSIQDLSALRDMTELRNVKLEIGDTKIKALPDMTFPSLQNISVDLEGNTSTVSMAEVGKLVVKELTVNNSIGSLAELPTSVNKLNLGRIISIEDRGQAGCSQQQ